MTNLKNFGTVELCENRYFGGSLDRRVALAFLVQTGRFSDVKELFTDVYELFRDVQELFSVFYKFFATYDHMHMFFRLKIFVFA